MVTESSKSQQSQKSSPPVSMPPPPGLEGMGMPPSPPYTGASVGLSNTNSQSSSEWQEQTAIDGRRYIYYKRTRKFSSEKPLESMTPIEEGEKAQEEIKRNIFEYRAFLKSCDFIEASTQWRKVQDRLEDDERCSRLDMKNRLEIFQEYVSDLEKEEDEQKNQKEKLRQMERKNRDEFRRLMEDHKASGLLTAKTHWLDYCPKVKNHPAYLAVASNTSGSPPKDLFEDVAEEMKKQYQEDKANIKDALKAGKFMVTSAWTLDKLKASIGEVYDLDAASETSFKLVFEEALEQAKQKEEKEAKNRQRLADDFKDLLYSVKEIVASSKWEDYIPLLQDAQEYRAISDESFHQEIFDEYIAHLQEKVKEKKLKRDEEKVDNFITFLPSVEHVHKDWGPKSGHPRRGQGTQTTSPRTRSGAAIEGTSGTVNVAGVASSTVNPFECPSHILKDFAKGLFDPKKPLVQFATRFDKDEKKNSGGSRVWECHLCHKQFRGSYTRVYCHLLWIGGQGVKGCKKITQDQKIEATRLHMEGQALSKGASMKSFNLQPSVSMDDASQWGEGATSSRGKAKKTKRETNVADLFNIQARDKAEASIAKFLYAHAIPFHVSHSSYFKEMFKDVIAAGPSFVPPEETKLRTTLLDKEYSKMTILMEDMRQTWMRDGCSIIMDGWTNIKHCPLINLIVNSTAGSYFLRAIDCSGKRKDAAFQFQILREAIEEIGASNVVQVVTDSARVCKLAGLMVESAYKHIFWTPCCVHALNNTLKDIGKIDWVKTMVLEARDVQMFICNHHTSLALSSTFLRKEFLKPMETRYANYFILLERMLEVQEALQSMVVNAEWVRWHEASTPEGKSVKQNIIDDNWWSTMRYICSFIEPIVRVIRNTKTNSPNLGEIYETFDSMLGQIKQVIHSRDPTSRFYEEHLGPIVTRRWNIMNNPLHMAAYALNPKWYAPRIGRVPPSIDEEVKDGFYKALAKMYNEDDSTKLRTQWLAFVNLHGPTFGKPKARSDRATLAQVDPIGWWTWHGRDAPDLRVLAVRLLSQVASSSAAERNWSTYSFIQSVKRNHLTSRRSEKLVVVHNALRLQERQTLEYHQTPTLRWDVNPEDAMQVEEEETLPGLVGVPLVEAAPYIDSDSDKDLSSDIDLDS